MADALRKHLLELLEGKSAHVDFDSAVADFPVVRAGEKPAGAPHSAWQLLEHMRLAQWDILEFSRNAKHVSPDWPDGYWPPAEAPPDAAAWRHSVNSFPADPAAMRALIAGPAAALFPPIPPRPGQTLLRAARLVA